MRHKLYLLFLSFSLLFAVNFAVAQSPQCRLMGCVHDGTDAVVVISVINPSDHIMNCTLEKTGLHSLKAEALDGRTFTDIKCFAESKCITDESQCVPFKVYPNQNNLVTIVINDVPKDLDQFNQISVLLKQSNQDSQKFKFSNVDVLAETISLPD